MAFTRSRIAGKEATMNTRAGTTHAWLWLTVPIALLLAIAAGSGLFVSGLYRDNDNILAQAVGQDLVSLAVVLPTLIVSALLASRGSARAWLVWLGAMGYLVYSYVTYAFAVRFNALFLVYVALLGCSLYALIGGLAATDLAGIQAHFTPKTPVRAVSLYLAAVVVLFYLLWLSEVVPALLTGAIPQSIVDDGTPTNAVQVVDMAWLLPAFAITAVMLRRKQALGYTLAGALLALLVLLVLAILSMAVLQVRQGQPGTVPMLVLFSALSAASLGMLLWYVQGLESLSNRRVGPMAATRA
jgi:hypothetical protein